MRIISEYILLIPNKNKDESPASVVPRSAVLARPETGMRVPAWIRNSVVKVQVECRKPIELDVDLEKIVDDLAVSEAKVRGSKSFF